MKILVFCNLFDVIKCDFKMKSYCFDIDLCLVSLGACLSEDESRWSDYSGVYVTVAGDDIQGYQFYTDFDAILEPSAESLKNLEWVKQARRVVIGFDLEGEQTDLESGKTYPVILKSAQQIPTFIVSVDTLSDEYQRNGLDSIALKMNPFVRLMILKVHFI